MKTLSELRIGRNYPPFIIAEMSGNHNQSLERALKIVEEAAKCGCNALKIQTYTADTMTIDVKKKWDWIIVPLSIDAEISAVDGNWAEMEEIEI